MSTPKLAIGDGAMGFWAALEEVFPLSRQQRCWQHKTMNVLNCLPKLSQPKAKKALHDIWQAETKKDAGKALDLFLKTYEVKYPKATLCLQKDRKELMAFVSVELERDRLDQIDAFKRKARQDRQVTNFYCIAGDADFMMVVVAKDIVDYEAFTHRFFFADKNIRKFRTSIVISTEKATLELPI